MRTAKPNCNQKNHSEGKSEGKVSDIHQGLQQETQFTLHTIA
jgi:hypothetical protein